VSPPPPFPFPPFLLLRPEGTRLPHDLTHPGEVQARFSWKLMSLAALPMQTDGHAHKTHNLSALYCA